MNSPDMDRLAKAQASKAAASAFDKLLASKAGPGLGNVVPPFATRPHKALIISAAKLLETDLYLSMSEAEFVKSVIQSSGGTVPPHLASDLYKLLMEDAGY